MGNHLYYNGAIITMRGEEPERVEAVLETDGRICVAGTFKEAEDWLREQTSGEECTRRDLKGAAMLPAFIDSHSHITAVAQVMGYADLNGTKSFEEIIARLSDFKKKAGLGPGSWLIGVGYDHNFLEEKRHPDKAVLDEAFPDNPVLISHASGHMGVADSYALKAMEITKDTKNPQGGVIGRSGIEGEPNGYLEETAFTSGSGAVPRPTMEQLSRQVSMAEELYLSHGIATIQDGITRSPEWEMLKYMAENRLLRADVVSYVDMKSDSALLDENPKYAGDYENHLRIGGYKIFLDGSPQGRTAWMSRPYEGAEDGYCGYPIYRDEEVETFFETAFKKERQLLVHCNGDAAAAQMITSCREAAKRTGCDPTVIRPVMIHAQLVRDDELKQMAALSITASFFVAHTYYWGDIHLKNFGRERALHISPARTAIKENVNVTFHQDSPVIPPDMMETAWCAVNRVSREGVVMGMDERISTYEALKAVTINGARQYGEETEKGTLEPGKKADFVILESDPLETADKDLRNIRVLETIKSGITVYRSEG